MNVLFYLREQLIDHTVANTSTAAGRSTLLADGVQLIEDDDVQSTLITLLLVLEDNIESVCLNDCDLVLNSPPSPRPRTAYGCSLPKHPRTCSESRDR